MGRGNPAQRCFWLLVFLIGAFTVVSGCRKTSTQSGLKTTGGRTPQSSVCYPQDSPACATPVSVGAPKLLFSDLDSGPNTGWEGSPTKGVAVTIWGIGFNNSRGSNFVTVSTQPSGGGISVNLTSNSDYVEWGVKDSYNARSLERTTFFLNNNVPSGLVYLTVNVGDDASNSVPFTVRPGRIFFVSQSFGSDSNNGTMSTSAGTANGPWKSFKKANPDPSKGALLPGDIVYVRSGTYLDTDEQSASIYIRDFPNPNNVPFAIVGYPGEWPVVGSPTGPDYGFRVYYSEGNDTAGTIGSLQIHKIIFESPIGGFGGVGVHDLRMVGDILRNNLKPCQCGIVGSTYGWNWTLYGLIFRNGGSDSFKHAIYPSGDFAPAGGHDTSNFDIGWSEFDHFRSDIPLGGANLLGSAAVNFRNANSTLSVHDVKVHDNYFHNMPDAAALYLENDRVSTMKDVYFYNNVLNGVSQAGTNSAAAAVYTTALTFYMYNNIFYNVGAPPRSGAYVLGPNGGYDQSSGPGHLFADEFNPGVYDDRPMSAVFLTKLNSPSKMYSANNIFYMTDPGATYYYANTDTLYSENDLYFGGAVVPSGPGFTVVNPIVNTSPQFANLAPTSTADVLTFMLQVSDSVAVKSGGISTMSIVPGGLGISDISSIVRSDFLFIARPTGGDYSLGVFQYTP